MSEPQFELSATVESDGGSVKVDVRFDLGPSSDRDAIRARVVALVDALTSDTPAVSTSTGIRLTSVTPAAGLDPSEPEPVPEPDAPSFASPPSLPGKKKQAAAGEVAAEGTRMWDMLVELADRGGVFEGSMAGLVRAIDGYEPSAGKAGKVLSKANLIRIEKMNATQTKAVHLTDAGWAHIGRQSPVLAAAGVEDRGGVEAVENRRVFDPDAARAAAASAI